MCILCIRIMFFLYEIIFYKNITRLHILHILHICICVRQDSV